MASETSIGRNFGSPLARAVAASASEVILLSSGPTAMNASMLGSRASSSIWLVPNCVTVTLSGATPDSVRITRSNAALAGVRPITPTLCPARSPISLILGALDRKAGRRPQHDEVLAHDSDGFGLGRHLEIAARDREIGFGSPEQGKAFHRSLGCDRRQPDRTTVSVEGLGHRQDQLLIVTSSRSDGNPEGCRPQRVIQRACGCGKKQDSGGQQQQGRVPAFASPARYASGFAEIVG